MVPRALQTKSAFLERSRSRGVPLDLRQEGRSLVFATFPVTSVGMSGDLAAICSGLKDHFIEVTAGHTFHSSMKQLTFSPYLSDIGPPRSFAFRVSHRPSEAHVFASATLAVAPWRSHKQAARVRTVIDALVSCIEQVRPAWLTPDDRSDLVSIFLAARP